MSHLTLFSLLLSFCKTKRKVCLKKASFSLGLSDIQRAETPADLRWTSSINEKQSLEPARFGGRWFLQEHPAWGTQE